MQKTLIHFFIAAACGLAGWGLPVAFPDLSPVYGFAALCTAAIFAFVAVVLGIKSLLRFWRQRDGTSGSAIVATPTISDGAEAVLPNARMSLLELRSEAKKHGWDVSGRTNLEVMDLLDGLRQALVDGLPAWGRPMRFEALSLIEKEPLSSITSNYWKDYEIETGGFADPSVLDSFNVSTYCMHNSARPDKLRYCDIMVDRQLAIKWLLNDALAFKGRRDNLNASRKKYA